MSQRFNIRYELKSGESSLSPKFRAALLIIMPLWAFVFDRVILLALLSVVSISLLASAKPPLQRVRWLLLLLALGAWGLITSQAIFYHFTPKTALFTLIAEDTPVLGKITGGVRVYREGLIFGAKQSLRLVISSCIALWVITTSSLSEIAAGLCSLLLPAHLSIIISSAIRFFPQVLGDMRLIYRVQHMKGLRLASLNPAKFLYNFMIIARPLVAVTLRRSRLAAEALYSRGIDVDSLDVLSKKVIPMKRWEKAVVALLIFLLLFSIAFRLVV